MVREGRDRLLGWVEVDETYVGGQEEWPVGRRKGSKVLVVVAAETDGPGIGRIRLRVIPNASAASLHGFIEDNVAPGSTVHTDAWQGYAGLEKKGYSHEVSPIRSRPKEASRLLPRVHRVVALLDRWLLGTHQGAVSHQHLPYYLDEFSFRFNRRKSKSRGKLFYRLVQQAVSTAPTSYSTLVSHAKLPPGRTQPVGAT
jgi:transposase-like protein